MEREAMQDGPNTHHFRTYRACTYHVVEAVDVEGVTHRFHVPLEVVASITSPLNQAAIYRNQEAAAQASEITRLNEEVDRLRAALEKIKLLGHHGTPCAKCIAVTCLGEPALRNKDQQ